MNSEKLEKARVYEREAGDKIAGENRPAFHLSPRAGWMNDPNGFSFYQGKYHLFYQYYPYKPFWGPMHWGHAVSDDCLHWTYLPAALAPDQAADGQGCFSGSALTLPDGRQLLMYTGVAKECQENGSVKDIQTQCLAVGDGENYEKYEKNPVLDADDLPKGLSRFDFRDPKIWCDDDGTYHCIVAGCNEEEDHDGCVLLFRSDDAFSWQFDRVLDVNRNRYGRMWECPDFFELDGKQLLIISPQDMLAQSGSDTEPEIANGNGVLCLIGSFDENSGEWKEEAIQTVDYGIDFYAPQTIQTPDKRRVMVGWMQNWDTANKGDITQEEDETQQEKLLPWFGQMTLPRELSVKNNRLIQWPIRELEACRKDPVVFSDVMVSGFCRLDGVCGRCADLELSISPKEKENPYYSFEIRVAEGDGFYTAIRYRPHESVLETDRRFSNSRRAFVHQRSCHVPNDQGKISLRVILDRFSAEVFVNGGEQAMTITFDTDLTKDGILFYADGAVLMDLKKYKLS